MVQYACMLQRVCTCMYVAAWVISFSLQDGNIPSGESFVRQFVIGQRFFKQEFGFYCKEVITCTGLYIVLLKLYTVWRLICLRGVCTYHVRKGWFII